MNREFARRIDLGIVIILTVEDDGKVVGNSALQLQNAIQTVSRPFMQGHAVLFNSTRCCVVEPSTTGIAERTGTE